MERTVVVALVIALAGASPSSGAPGLSCRPGASDMAEVELYFGAAGSSGAWARFVADVVTPRFPDGLTVLEGHGQWRGAEGLVSERTHVLIVYYRPDATSDGRIEEIRSAYRRLFRQRSVLRVDKRACVEF